MSSIYEERPWLSQYSPGMPADLDIPQNKSVIDFLEAACEKWKSSPAIIFYGNKITYKELQENVDRLATALTALGIKKGDRIGFLLLNSPEFIYSLYAVAKIGAISTPISPVYVSSEIQHQLTDSGAEHIICQDILYEGLVKTGLKMKTVILTNIAESLPKLKKIMGKSILRGVYQKMAAPAPEIYEGEGIYRFQDLLAKHKPDPPKVTINPQEDLYNLPYTGGTTGRPKGVMITHYNVIANYLQGNAILPAVGEGPKYVTMGFMPFYHGAGASGLTGCIFRGNTVIVVTTPDLDDIITDMVRYDVNFFGGAPTMFEMLKDYEKTDRVNWKKMKMLTCGADSLHENTARDWEERTETKITEGYGMTESTAMTHFNIQGKEKYGSIGVPAPSTNAAILDADKDEYMPVGEIGEIVFEGPQVTRGYWQRPDATKDCESYINNHRWWRTGDLGYMTADGFFSVYDRKRDLIKYKGLRVYAREVEEVLKEHPHIKEVGVVGEPDPLVGSNVKAVIVLEGDARGKTSERDIMEYCKDKMAAYKIPKIIEFVGEIPKTDIGKVSRREIRTQED